MMNFKNEEAVSPVIGVILMVAITVILAAVIAAFVFGMTSDMPDTTKNVALSVKAITGDNIAITVQGGSDLPKLAYLKVTVGDHATDSHYTLTAGKEIGAAANAPPTATISKAGEFTVGSVWKTADANAPLTPGNSQHIVVVGVFNDGSNQILAETYL